jgi:hypothetical protein
VQVRAIEQMQRVATMVKDTTGHRERLTLLRTELRSALPAAFCLPVDPAIQVRCPSNTQVHTGLPLGTVS